MNMMDIEIGMELKPFGEDYIFLCEKKDGVIVSGRKLRKNGALTNIVIEKRPEEIQHAQIVALGYERSGQSDIEVP